MKDKTKEKGQKQRFERKLALYAVAGGAVLAVPNSGNADVVYSGLLNQAVPSVTVLGLDIQMAGYDLQAGGATYFTLMTTGMWDTNQHGVAIQPHGINIVLSSDSATAFFGLAAPFQAGSPIDYTTASPVQVKSPSSLPTGVEPGFYGLAFEMGDGEHLGWVQVNDFRPIDINVPGYGTAQVAGFTLVDWAYQDEVMAGIDAGEGAQSVPEPSALSFLAMGALGLAAWRRRKHDTRSS